MGFGDLPGPIRIDLMRGPLVDLDVADLHVLVGVAIELAAPNDEDVAGGPINLVALLAQQL